MNRTHTNRFDDVLAGIQEKWGAEVLRPLGQMAQDAASIPTGFPALDAVLRIGGIPRNRLTTFSGKPTSGTTSLTYRVMAQAQVHQFVVVYLDAPHTFDPEYAVHCGVNLDLLLHVGPDTWEHTLDMLRDVVGLSVAGLLVFDASVPDIAAPGRLQTLATVLQRVGALLPQSTWTLVVLVPSDVTIQVDSGASLRLKLERLAWLREGETLHGYQTQITILKNKFGPVGEPVIIDLELKGQGL